MTIGDRQDRLFLGMDFGTSGARAIAIDTSGIVQFQTSCGYAESLSLADAWQTALWALLADMPLGYRTRLHAIAIDGTSATVLLCDRRGQLLDAPILYNDGRGQTVLERIQEIAPPQHPVLSATSSLAKLWWWIEQYPHLWQAPPYPQLLHQADWLSFLLHGQLGISDYHNSLKLGYDVGELRYPDWLQHQFFASSLPQVLTPGTPVATVTSAIATQWELPSDCWVCAGTTDSIAAFLASGAIAPGEAVTSLGSTLVLKLLSATRVDDARYGIYSHRLGDLWLVGGASNTGGAVLRQFFTVEELQRLSAEIDPTCESPLDYYPLPGVGDRFPINDSQLLPRLSPRPDDPVAFLQGLLESMARIETKAYRLLQELGATPVTQVYTAGGGANNPTWTAIRARQLGIPVVISDPIEAAYGAALLAQRSVQLQPRSKT